MRCSCTEWRNKRKRNWAMKNNNKLSAVLLTVIFIICRIPYLIAYYPGLMIYDTGRNPIIPACAIQIPCTVSASKMREKDSNTPV